MTDTLKAEVCACCESPLGPTRFVYNGDKLCLDCLVAARANEIKTCSFCDTYLNPKWKFCPICGMDLRKE